MAALRGTVQGERGTASRLAHRQLTVQASTWRTFATVEQFADGSGMVTIKQNGRTIHGFAWGSENVNG